MKTLKDVVAAVVTEMISCGDTFSAHDVTVAAREYVNTKPTDVVLGGGYVGNTWHKNLVNHADVKLAVADFHRQGQLKRTFGGVYFSYSGDAADWGKQDNNPAVAPVTANKAANVILIATVIGIIEDQLGVDRKDIKLHSRLIEDLGADSLDAIELAMAAEEEFDIEIKDAEAEKVKTVDDFVCYLEKNVAKLPTSLTPMPLTTNQTKTMPTATTKIQSSNAQVADLAWGYIRRNGRNTVQMIIGTIGRRGHSIAVDDFVEAVESDNRFKVSNNFKGVAKSYWIITVKN